MRIKIIIVYFINMIYESLHENSYIFSYFFFFLEGNIWASKNIRQEKNKNA